MNINPIDDSAFLVAAKSKRVVSVIRQIFSGSIAPVTIFELLAQDVDGSFLLESAEQGVWSRYSFIGIQSRGRLVQAQNGELVWFSNSNESALPIDSSETLSTQGLEAIQQMQKAWHTTNSESSIPLLSGLVGHIGWDVIRDLENLPPAKEQDIPAPRISFSMFRDLVVVDHHTGSLMVVSNVFVEGQNDEALLAEYSEAKSRISVLVDKLSAAAQPYLAEVDLSVEQQYSSNLTNEEFHALVATAKEHVVRGDVFQVVLSQRLVAQIDVSPLDLYRVLRTLNPSPYMYLLNGSDSSGKYAIVGSSPESLVSVVGENVVTHPIAGSRPRGRDWEEDHELEVDLLADKKEIAEHLMLVDLARNDLSKVCVPNSVTVSEFMQVHRFSHIMHLVSTVEGKLSPESSPISVFKATFPAGTLSGAPKPKALEIIERLEPTHRGIYGGVCGYFDFAGNADLAIAIRTAFIRNNLAVIQAGAGIVLDSLAESEYQETLSKARALTRAISGANQAKKIVKS